MIRVPRISLLWSVVAALILAPPATVSVRAAEFNASTGRGEVAVIFDDLPFVSTELDDTGRVRALLDRLIATIKSSQIPAVGFVNGSKLYRQGKIDTARVGLLQSWVNADLELGNHTFPMSLSTEAPLRPSRRTSSAAKKSRKRCWRTKA